MDDVDLDYSKLLENIFKGFIPDKFDTVKCTRVQSRSSRSPFAYVIVCSDTSFGTASKEMMDYSDELYFFLRSKAEDTLKNANITVANLSLTEATHLKYPHVYHTDTHIPGYTEMDKMVDIYFILRNPVFVLPEPEETEGGYESWMM